MENLPTPLSRVELYLAKACGMDVTVPEQPESRLEQFLAVIAGDTSVELPVPASLTELWLNFVAGGALTDEMKLVGAYWIGAQKVDVRFFAVAGGMDGVELPVPQNRTELYWATIAETLPVHGVLKYATGTSITLTDVVRGITSLENVYGDTFQQTYTGKNLFTTDFAYSFTPPPSDNNTFTLDRDTLRYARFDFPVELPVGTYTISFDVSDNNTGLGVFFNLFNSSQTSILVVSNIAKGSETYHYSGTFTVEEGIKIFRCFIAESEVSGKHATLSNVQIETGSTATPFEPYVGGIPAPNPDYPQSVNVVTGEQTVTITGKNQFDINTFVKGPITVVDGVATGAASQFYTRFQNGITLASIAPVMSITATAYRDGSSSSGNGIIFRAFYTDETNENIVLFPNSTTAATTLIGTTDSSKTLDHIGIVYGSGGSNVWHISKVQVEAGTTVTDYEPYQSSGYTVNLGSIELAKVGTYQDYIYKSGTDWYLHKALGKTTFDGTENWVLSTTTHFARVAVPDALILDTQSTIAPAASDYFTATTWLSISTPNVDNGIAMYYTGEARIGIRNKDFTTLTQYTTWLSTHNITVYYALATATDTKITDSTLITQLNTLSRARLPKPVAYLTVGASSPNLPAPIKISYYGEEE